MEWRAEKGGRMKWWEEKEEEGKCLATVSVARLLQHFAMQKSKGIVCS